MVVYQYKCASEKVPESRIWLVNCEHTTDIMLATYEEAIVMAYFVTFSYPEDGCLREAIVIKDNIPFYCGQPIFTEPYRGEVSLHRYIQYGNVYIMCVFRSSQMGYLFIDSNTLDFIGSYSPTLGGVMTSRVAGLILFLSKYIDFDTII